MRRRGVVIGLTASGFVLFGFTLLHIIAGYAHTAYSTQAVGIDDAYISFRYADNLVHGRGLVYNGGERVEGYSNFLFVLLIALGICITDHPYLIACIVSFLALGGALWLFFRHSRRLFGEKHGVLAAALFALSPSLWCWASSGMETVPVILVQLLIWFAVERIVDENRRSDIVVLSTVFLFSILLRADGFILPGIAVLYLFMRGRVRAGLWCCGAVFMIVAPYLACRYAYYGFPLPNTYYAKVHGPLATRVTQAVGQLGNLIVDWGMLPHIAVLIAALGIVLRQTYEARARLFLLPDVAHLGVTALLGVNLIVGRVAILPRSSWRLSVFFGAALAAAAWIGLRGQQLVTNRPVGRLVLRYLPWAFVVFVTLRYQTFSFLPIGALVAFVGIMTLLDSSPWLKNSPFPPFFGGLWLLYWLYIGGDYFDERFLLILFPLGIFAFLASVEQKTLPRRLLGFFAGVFVVFQLQPIALNPRFGYTCPKYDSWILLGEFLGRNHPGEMLATGAAGKIPYFSKLPTIDMLGLNDEFIAHKDVDLGSIDRYPVGHNKYDADYVLSRKPDLIANWIDYDGNMSHGLDRAAYERCGYRLKYLLNTERFSCPNNIVDVTHLPEDVILRFVRSSYKYAVIERSS